MSKNNKGEYVMPDGTHVTLVRKTDTQPWHFRKKGGAAVSGPFSRRQDAFDWSEKNNLRRPQ